MKDYSRAIIVAIGASGLALGFFLPSCFQRPTQKPVGLAADPPPAYPPTLGQWFASNQQTCPTTPVPDADLLAWATWAGQVQDWQTSLELDYIDNAPRTQPPVDGYPDTELVDVPARADFLAAPVYSVTVYADGQQVQTAGANSVADLSELLVSVALRWAKMPVRYAVDPDTGMLDPSKPLPTPRIAVQIWDSQLVGGCWVDADGNQTDAPDGLFPVEVTVHIGNKNR